MNPDIMIQDGYSNRGGYLESVLVKLCLVETVANIFNYAVFFVIFISSYNQQAVAIFKR